MFIKKFKSRKFDYQPRYYKPGQDEEEMNKRRLQLRSKFTRDSKKKSPYIYIVLLLVVIYIMLKYNGVI